MSHLVACPIFLFFWFFDRDWQEGVLKRMKSYHFLVFLSVWVLFPSFWAGKGVTYVRIAQNNKSVTYSCVPNRFPFIL